MPEQRQAEQMDSHTIFFIILGAAPPFIRSRFPPSHRSWSRFGGPLLCLSWLLLDTGPMCRHREDLPSLGNLVPPRRIAGSVGDLVGSFGGSCTAMELMMMMTTTVVE